MIRVGSKNGNFGCHFTPGGARKKYEGACQIFILNFTYTRKNDIIKMALRQKVFYKLEQKYKNGGIFIMENNEKYISFNLGQMNGILWENL